MLAVVLVAGWTAWQWAFPSDEAQIEAVLERIAENLAGGAAEAEVARLARAASLRHEFAPDVVIDAGEPLQRINGREALVGMAARLHGTVRNLEVRFHDLAIVVAPDRQAATATVTAEARFDDGAGRGIEARDLAMTFTRVDGDWVVASVSLIRALERLDGR